VTGAENRAPPEKAYPARQESSATLPTVRFSHSRIAYDNPVLQTISATVTTLLTVMVYMDAAG